MLQTHPKLQHLNDSELIDLISRYETGEKVSSLTKLFAIDVKPAKLKSILPLQKSELNCHYCNNSLYYEVQNTKQPYERIYKCRDCGHFEYFSKYGFSRHCRCANCEQKIQDQIKKSDEEKFNLIQSEIFPEVSKQSISEINYIESLYLAATLRAGLNEKLELIDFANISIPLTPYEKLSRDILKILFDRRLLLIDSSVPLENFNISGEVVSYDPLKVIYKLNIKNENDNKKTINELMNPNPWQKEDFSMVGIMWNTIAIEECIATLLMNMKEVGFSFEPGDKTRSMFNELLKNFSVAQIQSIILHSIKEAYHYYVTKGINRNHAANSVISLCLTYGERAIANNWTINPYKRWSKCPQSWLSKVFFERIYPIGDKGFTLAPGTFSINSNIDNPIKEYV
jgi:hypothetical protein